MVVENRDGGDGNYQPSAAQQNIHAMHIEYT